MYYTSPTYKPAPDAVIPNSGIIKVVITVLVFLGILSLLVATGLALGLGLGLGLTKPSDSIVVSTLYAPTVSCDASTAQCGCPVTAPTFSSRIINGDVATSNSWPWMVAIYIGTSRICSGFLVTKQHVVTAANCVYNVDETNITAYVGITTLSARNNGHVRNVTSVTYPSTYSAGGTIGDIAVLTLNSNITLSSKIALCCYSSNTLIPQLNEHAVVAGWGEVSLNSSVSNTLRQAVVQVLNPSTCGVLTSHDSQFCANYDSISTCPSDTGGPLMTSASNAWLCSGIVSGGSSGCNSVGIYTRVSYYSAFISSATTY